MNAADVRFMRLALEEARKGRGRVHPNPLVGAVLTRGRRVIASGAHLDLGGPHAEVRALKGQRTRGATLYVTLEPCSHFGKTPPCADLLISLGLRRVVVAMTDPNPLVAGKGIRRLRQAGIRVDVGCLEEEAKELNRAYLHWIRTSTPWVTLKLGQSLDGKIATRTGDSRWITGDESRQVVQEMRRDADAILVGAGTVLKDDPRLSVRLSGVKAQPVRVVLDAALRTPPGARLFKETSSPVLVYCAAKAPASRAARLAGKAELVRVRESRPGYLDWGAILRDLGRRGITHLLIEGGGEVAASAVFSRVVQEAYLFIAPMVIGGRDAVPSVSGDGAARLSQAIRLKSWAVRRVGEDLLVRGRF